MTHTDSEAILLLDHGSRDPEAKIEFEQIADALRVRCGLPVSPAYLELAEPPVLDQLKALAKAGIRKVWALSAFLLPAGHVKSDLPAALSEARREFGLEIEYGKPLGLHPALLLALRDRWREAASGLPTMTKEDTAVLIVGRGSSDPDANGEVAKLARLVFESGECEFAQTAYVSIARPFAPEGLAQCAALGAKQIVVLPFFLCTGVLVRRIRQQAEAWAAAYPAVRVATADHIGLHPGVLEALLERLTELRSGEDRSIWCDRCKFRAALPGHEHSLGAAITSDHTHGLRHSRSHAALAPSPSPQGERGEAMRPEEITRRSFEIIDAQLRTRGIGLPTSLEQRAILRRVIHTTADFEYADLLEFSAGVIEAGRAALASGAVVICDVRMVQMGLTGLEGRVLCFVDDETVRAESRATGETRSALGLRKALVQAPEAIVVIGNAPTALWETLRLIDSGAARPRLVLGVPVGFVGAAESKEALRQRADVEWIITRGRKGGSGVAAAIVNVLMTEHAQSSLSRSPA
ncbi:MAG: precorrin-8X methylmutase [Chloroflexi bacterium]|nr:precorrin-8X methylmutase [Chloroflexota bacterium]